jgi:hypothetical protein
MVYRKRKVKRGPGPEHRIQNDIIAMLNLNRCSVYRINVGKVRTPDGRFFSTGAPNGMPDLFDSAGLIAESSSLRLSLQKVVLDQIS